MRHPSLIWSPILATHLHRPRQGYGDAPVSLSAAEDEEKDHDKAQ